MSTRHFLDPVRPTRGELLSDADPATSGIIEMADGSLRHYVVPGSLHDQLGNEQVPLSSAHSEGSAASADQRNWGSRGASNSPSIHNKPGV